MSRPHAPDGPDGDIPKPDAVGWEREHAVDHADFLDALLDPDDPLQPTARRERSPPPAVSCTQHGRPMATESNGAALDSSGSAM